MASFQVTGFVSQVKYLPDSVLVYIDEYVKGYKRRDGVLVDDKYLTWKCIYKPYFKKFVADHFNNGMLVEVKGEVVPYAVENGKIVEGFSVLGQTLNLASFPRASAKQEKRMIRESQNATDEEPDLDGYNSPDF